MKRWESFVVWVLAIVAIAILLLCSSLFLELTCDGEMVFSPGIPSRLECDR